MIKSKPKPIAGLDKRQLHPAGSVEAQYRQLEKDLEFYWDKQSGCLDIDLVEKVSCSLCGEPPPLFYHLNLLMNQAINYG